MISIFDTSTLSISVFVKYTGMRGNGMLRGCQGMFAVDIVNCVLYRKFDISIYRKFDTSIYRKFDISIYRNLIYRKFDMSIYRNFRYDIQH